MKKLVLVVLILGVILFSGCVKLGFIQPGIVVENGTQWIIGPLTDHPEKVGFICQSEKCSIGYRNKIFENALWQFAAVCGDSIVKELKNVTASSDGSFEVKFDFDTTAKYCAILFYNGKSWEPMPNTYMSLSFRGCGEFCESRNSIEVIGSGFEPNSSVPIKFAGKDFILKADFNGNLAKSIARIDENCKLIAIDSGKEMGVQFDIVSVVWKPKITGVNESINVGLTPYMAKSLCPKRDILVP